MTNNVFRDRHNQKRQNISHSFVSNHPFITHKETPDCRRRGEDVHLEITSCQTAIVRVLDSNLRLQITIQCHIAQHTLTIATPTRKKEGHGSKFPEDKRIII